MVARLVRIHRLTGGRSVQLRDRSVWAGSARVSVPKLEQIVTNLLVNALDLVPQGTGRIDIGVDRLAEEIHVSVADNGPGVDPAIIARIFDPFVTTKPEGKGTGLGLAISRRLARSMGGDLVAANGPDGGAVFTLRLPVRESVPGTPGLAQAAASPQIFYLDRPAEGRQS